VTFIGGDHHDTADYGLAPAGVEVTKDVIANDGVRGVDGDNIGTDVEELRGSAFADHLLGSMSATTLETFHGGGGDDTLSGRVGPDQFVAAAVADGADRIDGGSGSDSLTYAARTEPVLVSVDDGFPNDGAANEGDQVSSIESLGGGAGNDQLSFLPSDPDDLFLYGYGGNDLLSTGAGDDVLDGGPGRDGLTGFDGNDTFRARDGEADGIACGAGVDNGTADAADSRRDCDSFLVVGKLEVHGKPKIARDGTARLKLSWRHPEGWKQLKRVTLHVTRDGAEVGSVAMDLRKRSARGSDAVAVRRSKLTRDGKTVAARLKLKLDPSIARSTLKLTVEAEDVKNRHQVELDAATLRPAPGEKSR
jgi:hypothetical protein